MKKYFTPALVVGLGVLAGTANATLVVTGTGIGISGQALSAKAEIDFNDALDLLTITLTNLAGAALVTQGNTLTGFYWKMDPIVTLNKSNVVLNSGSVVSLFNVTQAPGSYNLKDEWAYKGGLSGYTPSPTLNYGVSSAGLGLFGGAETFSGAGTPDGSAFGIIPTAGVTGGGGTSSRAYVKNSVVLSFTTTAHIKDSDFKKFGFQYGTALDEPSTEGNAVPEPASMFAMAIGVVGILRARSRRS